MSLAPPITYVPRNSALTHMRSATSVTTMPTSNQTIGRSPRQSVICIASMAPAIMRDRIADSISHYRPVGEQFGARHARDAATAP